MLKDLTMLAGTLIAGTWQLESQLGTGSFGDVWIGRHAVSGRRKAIKLLHAQFSSNAVYRMRFEEEARASAQIESPHVVSIDDVGFDEGTGRAYMVMELLRGVTLFDHLVESPYFMAPGEVLAVMQQLAAALDAAHAAGVVHRDLKPENIFLCWRDDGTLFVKVVDFGIAKLQNLDPNTAGDRRLQRVRTEGFLGTPGYAAPEQIVSARDVNLRADIFSLGVITYEMLAGCSYWKSDDQSILSEVFEGNLEPPSQRLPDVITLPTAFDAWFLQACAKDPSQRFSSAGEAYRQLDLAFAGLYPLAVPTSRTSVQRLPRVTGSIAEPVFTSRDDLGASQEHARMTDESALRTTPTRDGIVARPSTTGRHNLRHVSEIPPTTANRLSIAPRRRTRIAVYVSSACALVAAIVFTIAAFHRRQSNASHAAMQNDGGTGRRAVVTERVQGAEQSEQRAMIQQTPTPITVAPAARPAAPAIGKPAQTSPRPTPRRGGVRRNGTRSTTTPRTHTGTTESTPYEPTFL